MEDHDHERPMTIQESMRVDIAVIKTKLTTIQTALDVILASSDALEKRVDAVEKWKSYLAGGVAVAIAMSSAIGWSFKAAVQGEVDNIVENQTLIRQMCRVLRSENPDVCDYPQSLYRGGQLRNSDILDLDALNGEKENGPDTKDNP